jgi:Zn-dependent protease with chaperone function
VARGPRGSAAVAANGVNDLSILSGDASPSVPVGAITAAALASVTVGAVGAKLSHDVYPDAAIGLAPVLAVGLYVLIRVVSKAQGNSTARSMLMISAALLTCLYFFVLAGETFHPLRSRDAALRFVQMLTFLARSLSAGALPIVIACVAAWQAAGDVRQNVRPGALAPLVVGAGLGAVSLTASMTILGAIIVLVPHAWVPWALIGLVLVLPMGFFVLWPTVYALVLARWEVERPSALVRGLADLKSQCGFQFDRIICLDASYGNGRIAGVTFTFRSTTLLISETLASVLDRNELLAVLAHETAHVELHHFQRKLMLGVPARAVALTGSVALSMSLGLVVPRSLDFLRYVVAGGSTTLWHPLYERFVTREHEREADEYAARAVSAGALLHALEKIGADRSPLTANRWTTHSTWEIRSGRLKDLDERGE